MAIYRIRQHGEADMHVKAKAVSVEPGNVKVLVTLAERLAAEEE